MNKSSLRCGSCKAGIMCDCMKTIKTESVDHPVHYLKDTGHEVIDVINAWSLNFELGSAIKYIARAGKKNKEKTAEDLNKALWLIQFEIDKLKEK
jgi:hypothetical protein